MKTNTILFRVAQESETDSRNEANYRLAMAYLKWNNIPYIENSVLPKTIEVDSKWKGQVHQICATYSQQCYLLLNERGGASIVWADESIQKVGSMYDWAV